MGRESNLTSNRPCWPGKTQGTSKKEAWRVNKQEELKDEDMPTPKAYGLPEKASRGGKKNYVSSKTKHKLATSKDC